MPIITAVRRLKQEDREFQISLESKNFFNKTHTHTKNEIKSK
jgi:hypothetical protein